MKDPGRPVALVTGATRGIGRATAEALLRDGFAVALNHLSHRGAAREAARELAGRPHRIVPADVRTPAGARRAVRAVIGAWGRLDVLVNNVGDFFETPVSAMDLPRWEELWTSNARTAWNVTRAALPHLRRAKGAVVNMGGTGTSVVRGNPRYVAYVMAKAALMVFTKSLAQSEGPRGVRVNMVCPGYIRTYAYSEADAAELAPKIPMRRLGRPEEVAEAVSFLAGPKASYVTGAVVDVGGGLGV